MKALWIAVLLALVLVAGCSGPTEAGPGDVVPSVVGLSLTDAKGAILDAGYDVGAIVPRNASWDAVVSAQDPTAGSVEPRGTRIDLTTEGGY